MPQPSSTVFILAAKQWEHLYAATNLSSLRGVLFHFVWEINSKLTTNLIGDSHFKNNYFFFRPTIQAGSSNSFSK
jgi:hypothetical protein